MDPGSPYNEQSRSDRSSVLSKAASVGGLFHSGAETQDNAAGTGQCSPNVIQLTVALFENGGLLIENDWRRETLATDYRTPSQGVRSV